MPSLKTNQVCSCFTCPNSILHKNSITCARSIFDGSISIGKSMTFSCENSIEYFNRDTYDSFELLKEKLDELKESNSIKDEVITPKIKKSDPPSAKTVYDYINK